MTAVAAFRASGVEQWRQADAARFLRPEMIELRPS